jgi:putative phage-type endonuclease
MNRQEWLQKRKIGSSDAPIIMGVSPWTTPYQLWMQKITGTERKDNPAMKRGRDLEETARRHVEKKTGFLLVPTNVTCTKYNFMTASLDGLDLENDELWEIKWPGEKDHAMAKAGRLPEKYIPQCQHQLECIEFDKMTYASFFVKNREKDPSLIKEEDIEVVEVTVYRDEAFIKKMIAQEAEFWDMLLNQRPPNKQAKDEPYEEASQFLSEKYIQVKEAAEKRKYYEEEEEKLKKELIHLSEGKNIKFPDAKLYQSLVKGSVQYDQIPELKGVNVDQYRKEPFLKWTLRFN